jgi:hypothetical protein
MTIASDLLQRHIQTLVEDNAQWQTLIADDLLWELPYAPTIGHPARLSGREEVMRHVTWFLGAMENFRFFDFKVYALADPKETEPVTSTAAHAGIRGLGTTLLGSVGCLGLDARICGGRRLVTPTRVTPSPWLRLLRGSVSFLILLGS